MTLEGIRQKIDQVDDAPRCPLEKRMNLVGRAFKNRMGRPSQILSEKESDSARVMSKIENKDYQETIQDLADIQSIHVLFRRSNKMSEAKNFWQSSWELC